MAIDPKGDWWGLRSNAAGDGPGLPVPIFGGLHGDLPLAPESGRLMADLIVEHNLTCILDVSRFSKAARIRFAADFALRLYELHQADPQPRHVFLEEADRLLPQRIMAADKDMARCVGAYSDLIRLGGAFGLGVTLISQRAAVINKDGLTQVETMVAMRTTSPQDRKAIRDWMDHHAIAAEIVESLPGLLSGEAWVSSSFFLAEHGYEAIQRIRFRQRRTFDSGATPKVGQQRRVATLADIDLGALETRMADVVEKAAADDPRALRKQIADLKRQLANAGSADDSHVVGLRAENAQLRYQLAAAEAREPERVEVPVLSMDVVDELRKIVTTMRSTADGVSQALLQSQAERVLDMPSMPAPAPRHLPLPPTSRALVAEPTSPAAQPRPVDVDAAAAGKPLGRAERKILAVLAQFTDGRTRIQLSLLSGYSAKSSGYSNALGALRSAGLINRGEPIQITPEGLAAIGNSWEPLPTGEALVDHWMTQLGKAERTILRCLLDVFPASVTRDELAAAADYSPTSSGYSNALGRLRSLNLINKGADIMADPDFAREVGRG